MTFDITGLKWQFWKIFYSYSRSVFVSRWWPPATHRRRRPISPTPCSPSRRWARATATARHRTRPRKPSARPTTGTTINPRNRPRRNNDKTPSPIQRPYSFLRRQWLQLWINNFYFVIITIYIIIMNLMVCNNGWGGRVAVVFDDVARRISYCTT